MVQGQIRTLKDGLDTRYGTKVREDHPCLPWLIMYAGDLLTWLRIGKDGKTAWTRWKGRPFKKELVEFGECVLYSRPGSRGKDKLDPRWEEGIWLGVKDSSGETIIGTREGVVKVRDVKMKARKEDRWNVHQFNELTGTPWEPIPGRPGVEITTRVNIPDDGEGLSKEVEGETRGHSQTCEDQEGGCC